MAGRPPKPTALKILQGNPGKRPLNLGEPKPAKGAEPPAYVKASPELLKEWTRQSEMLMKYGLLTVADADALATLCAWELKWIWAVESDAAPQVLVNISKEKRAIWGRFGMTPADRARVKVDKPKDVDPLAEFEVHAGGKA